MGLVVKVTLLVNIAQERLSKYKTLLNMVESQWKGAINTLCTLFIYFFSLIITQNDQIWFHDGMTLQHSMSYEGLLDTKLCPNIVYSNIGNAILSIHNQTNI